MNKITSTYHINHHTIAILPAKQIEFDSIVMEQNKQKRVRQTTLQLIKTACYNDWTTYEGRRQAVMRHTNFKQKVPIPTSLHHRICFFPTHAPSSHDNSWIAFKHISRIEKSSQNTQNQTIIHFKNGQTIEFDISMHILRKQMERAFACIYQMESMLKGK